MSKISIRAEGNLTEGIVFKKPCFYKNEELNDIVVYCFRGPICKVHL